ncbi:MAG: hypothetical protein GX657_14895 [Chloroflexi bacterium]|nr:hypothetical protein [Chloroflexota bacterium]
MTDNDVQRLLRQAHRAWFLDGLPQAFQGVLLLAAAAYFWWRGSEPAAGPLTSLIAVGAPCAILAYGVGMRSILLAVKKATTLSRHVPLPEMWGEPLRRRALALSGTVLAGSTIWATARTARLQTVADATLSWMALFFSLGLGVAMLLLGERLCLLRFHLLAALSGLLGALSVYVAPTAGPVPASAVYLGAMGAALTVSGIGHLVWFAAKSSPAGQPPAEE